MKANAITSAPRIPHSAFVNGFSLLETVVALAIIALGLLSVMGLFSSGMKLIQRDHYESCATMIAQNVFNELASASPNNAFLALHNDWSTNESSRLKLNLKNAGTYTITFDHQGVPIKEPESERSRNASFYQAIVSVSPREDQSGLSQIDIVVSLLNHSRLNAPPRFNFVTLMRNQ